MHTATPARAILYLKLTAIVLRDLRRGGDGLVLEIEFLRPMRVSILSERRVRRPFGLNGGGPGSLGLNLHNAREIGGRTSVEVSVGDRIRIETPGGGGYGEPQSS